MCEKIFILIWCIYNILWNTCNLDLSLQSVLQCSNLLYLKSKLKEKRNYLQCLVLKDLIFIFAWNREMCAIINVPGNVLQIYSLLKNLRCAILIGADTFRHFWKWKWSFHFGGGTVTQNGNKLLVTDPV